MRVSLFWRTFALVAVVVVVSVLIGFQLLQRAERAPRAERLASEIASVVNLTRAALISSTPQLRPPLLDDLARDEGVRVIPLEPGDRFEPLASHPLGTRLHSRLRELLGPSTQLAGSVNGRSGVWVSFEIDSDPYWLAMAPDRLDRGLGTGWLGWLALTLAGALIGALAISRVLNRPLARLANAIEAIARTGQAPQLDENAPSEIAAVNRRFNRMAADLTALEEDRAQTLAGISHDLRTPLTRLRMEIELSALSGSEKASMAEEIGRIDEIVGQFIEYARPVELQETQPVDVARAIAGRLQPYQQRPAGDTIKLDVAVPAGLLWQGHATVLNRIITNLLENAQRHGRNTATGIAQITVRARQISRGIEIDVVDTGPGVPPQALPRLGKPFARLDKARGGLGGSGLGLAIVGRLSRRYGGDLRLENVQSGGLRAVVTLPDGPASRHAGSQATDRQDLG